MTTLPEPKVRLGNRTRTLNYPTGVTTPEGAEIVAQVFCAHNGDRKCFTASLKSVKVGKQNGFTTESFWVFSGVNLGKQSVARYSAKAFDQFVDDIRNALPEVVAGNPTAAAIFRGESEA